MSEAQAWTLGDARAIVTGGSSGIGLATVAELRRHGARVAVLDLVAPDDPDLYAVRVDVADDASVRAGVAEAVAHLGGLEVLVNNAGIGAVGTVEDNGDDEWRRVFEVNVLGIVRVTRAALPALRVRRGSIVNTSSVAATVGLVQRAVYSASKGAVLALTRAMAADYLREGIRVNCVNPGTAETPWVERLLQRAADPDAERAALVARQPHGRLVRAEEVASAIVALASPASGSTTGAAVEVDGGLSRLRLPPS